MTAATGWSPRRRSRIPAIAVSCCLSVLTMRREGETSILALQLAIGVGIALLFPLLIYTGVAMVKAPPKPSDRTNLQAETSEDIKRANQELIRREREALQKARIAYAKILFTVMAPTRSAASSAPIVEGCSMIRSALHHGLAYRRRARACRRHHRGRVRADPAIAAAGVANGVENPGIIAGLPSQTAPVQLCLFYRLKFADRFGNGIGGSRVGELK
jgi:hypothetical protein